MFLPRVALILEILILASSSKGLSQQMDTLQKYSQILPVNQQGAWNNHATGFFIKKNGKVFLVSNYHVFASQNTMEKKPLPPTDSMCFFYKTPQNTAQTVKFSLRQIRQTSKPAYFFERPDVFAYDVSKLISNKRVPGIIENQFNEIPGEKDTLDLIAIGYSMNNLSNATYKHFKPLYNKEDVILYGPDQIKVSMKRLLFVSGQSEAGLSGSPLFMKYRLKRNKDQSVHVAFIGLVSSHFPQNNSTLIVTKKEIFSEIKKKSK